MTVCSASEYLWVTLVVPLSVLVTVVALPDCGSWIVSPSWISPAALALLRVPNSFLSRIVRWRLGRCRVRVDRDGAPLRLYVVSAVDHQGVAVPLRDTRLRAWAVDPCRPFHREVHTSECCIRQGRSWRLTRPLTNREEEGGTPARGRGGPGGRGTGVWGAGGKGLRFVEAGQPGDSPVGGELDEVNPVEGLSRPECRAPT